MCLSVPAKILEIKNNKAVVDSFGKKIEADTELVKDIKKGDYGLVSNGFIVKKVSANEAEEILEIIGSKKEAK